MCSAMRLPHRRVRHAPHALGARAARHGGRSRRGRRRPGRVRAQHVLDRDAPARAAARDAGGIQAAFGQQAPHRRTQRRRAARRRRVTRRHRFGVGAPARHPRAAGLHRLRRAGGLDVAEQLARGDLVLLVAQDLTQHARLPATAPRRSPCRSRSRSAARCSVTRSPARFSQRRICSRVPSDSSAGARISTRPLTGVLTGSPGAGWPGRCGRHPARPPPAAPGRAGLGMSGMASRSIGASRLKKHSCASMAAISAPKPAVRLSSCTIRQRRVLFTEARTLSLSQGESVRRSSTSASTCERAAAASQRSTIAPQVTTVSSLPGAHGARLAERHHVVVARIRAPRPGAVEHGAVLEEDRPGRCRAAPRAAGRPRPRRWTAPPPASRCRAPRRPRWSGCARGRRT